MVDPDTFLTALYVVADEISARPTCRRRRRAPVPRPHSAAALSRAESLTLAIFGQWHGFGGERGVLPLCPPPPAHRLPGAAGARAVRPSAPPPWWRPDGLHPPPGRAPPGPARASRGARYRGRADPRRQAARRRPAARPGRDIGWSNRLGWSEGVRLLLAVTPAGVITGFALAPASTEDQPLAETFFALRRHPHPRASSVGAPATGPYLTDEGFEGRGRHRRWARDYGAVVICPPPRRRTGVPPWPRAWRRWLAGKRQVVETAIAKLAHAFRLGRERPHSLDGLQARLAAKVALHNFCLWLNGQLSRPPLAFADLVDW